MATTEDLAVRIEGKLLDRIEKLETVFGHIHESAVKGDICTFCGLDLRDQIHTRLDGGRVR